MANEISTAGIALKYAVESTAGTRPTTGFTEIADIKSLSEMGASPDALEVTNLADTKWKRYIPGLSDLGGDWSCTANMTAALKTAWAALVTASETAFASSKSTWFEIVVPNIGSFYFSGRPVEMGFGGAEVNSVSEITLHIVPNGCEGWGTSST